MEKPQFQHDCQKCKFLGRHEKYDLYVCPSGSLGSSLIARFGSKGPDYGSMGVDLLLTVEARHIASSDSLTALLVAYHRAIDRLILPTPIKTET